MSYLFALLSGLASFFNYSLWQGSGMRKDLFVCFLQFLFFLLGLTSLVIFKDKSATRMFWLERTKYMTFRFSICFMAFVGSGSILGLMLLKYFVE